MCSARYLERWDPGGGLCLAPTTPNSLKNLFAVVAGVSYASGLLSSVTNRGDWGVFGELWFGRGFPREAMLRDVIG